MKLKVFGSEKTLRALGDGLISLYDESNMSLGVLEGPVFGCQVDRVSKLQGYTLSMSMEVFP